MFSTFLRSLMTHFIILPHTVDLLIFKNIAKITTEAYQFFRNFADFEQISWKNFSWKNFTFLTGLFKPRRKLSVHFHAIRIRFLSRTPNFTKTRNLIFNVVNAKHNRPILNLIFFNR